MKSIDSGFINKGTICDNLRRIWEMSEDKPDVQALCEEAYDMAKRMDGKLRWYKRGGVYVRETRYLGTNRIIKG